MNEYIRSLKRDMIARGEPLADDDEFGPKTLAAIKKNLAPFTAPVTKPDPAGAGDPYWMKKAEEYKGKKENEPVFNKFLSGFWKIVGLPNYKTLVGTSFAWCGLFVAAVLNMSDLPWQKSGAGAKNWAQYGVAIEYKKVGIPRGAILHLDHDKDCKGGGNHVTFANGDCSPEDVVKSGATFAGLGGNQGNQVKVSVYSTKEICAVRWPTNVPAPAPVKVSKNCTSTGSTGESTR